MSCRFCNRPASECHEPVDDRFPPEAREAYEVNQVEVAHKCPQGQAYDIRMTASAGRFGWCFDRALMHHQWTGDIPHGIDPMHEREAEVRALRPKKARA